MGEWGSEVVDDFPTCVKRPLTVPDEATLGRILEFSVIDMIGQWRLVRLEIACIEC